MPANPGASVYLSSFASDKQLPSWIREGSYVFTSAHIPEENPAKISGLLHELTNAIHQKGAYVLCDVDGNTAADFGFESIAKFAHAFGIDRIRLDDGFLLEDMLETAKQIPIALNASTTSPEEIQAVLEAAPDTLFVHNFYPRPETGLDVQTFASISAPIPKESLAVFIPGDEQLRGPLYEGLVTLEDHRHAAPYAAFAHFASMGIEHILVADPGLGKQEQEYMEHLVSGILSLPAAGLPAELYEREFTIRKDSNCTLKRLPESRGLGRQGTCLMEAGTPDVRKAGSITMDNQKYGRYAGEIMIVCKDLPFDERVNVIGQIPEAYHLLLDSIEGGAKIRFVPAAERARPFIKEMQEGNEKKTGSEKD